MKLVPKNIKLDQLQIDRFNPRFVEGSTLSQTQILAELLKKKYVKELLKSMQVDIKWVNRIVVREVKNHQHSNDLNLDDGKYVVVEGNTRTACLKSGKIDAVDDEYEVPVLVATKERTERREEYLKQIKITQGIANVTVVKEWEPLSKAKHLHELYLGYKAEFSTKTPNQIYKIIADELGKSIHEIRQAIIRYAIYKQVSDVSDTIQEEKFPYLEAFEKNKETRALIGMDAETNEFDIDEEEDHFELETLEKIPDLIKQASNNGFNTKQFRDLIHKKLVTFSEPEQMTELVNSILDEDNEVSLHSLMDEGKTKDLKVYWDDKLKKVESEIVNYPIAPDWSAGNKTRLISIKDTIEKIISAL